MRQIGQVTVSARLVVLLGVGFASFSSIFIRFSQAPSLVIAFYRMFFAALIMLPFFIRNAGVEGERATGGDWLRMGAAGFFLALHFAAWISSLSLTTVASSVVLVNTHPILVFFLSRLFFKERGTAAQLFFILLTITGSAILSVGDMRAGEGALSGDLLAFIGAMMVGLYLIVGRSVRRRHSLAFYTSIVYSSSAFFLLLFVLAAGRPLFGYPAREWMLFLLLAVVCTILGHSLYNWALKYISTTFVSVTILIEPVAAAAMAYGFFGEVPGRLAAIGAVLVLAGIYLYGRSRGESEKRAASRDRPPAV